MLKKIGVKIYEKMMRFGPSLMPVIALIPIAGILLGLGVMMQDAQVISWLPILGSDIMMTISTMLMMVGKVVFNNLAILFAISIAMGLSDNDGIAGLGAAVAYLMMNQSMGSLLGVSAEKAVTEYTRYTTMLGIPTLQTGVFGGIVIGIIVAWVYKRFSDLEFHPAFAFFQGKRFVPIAAALAGVITGAIFCIVWPPLQNGLNFISESMIDSNLPFASFVYGFVGRLLVPFGLHHAWYPAFYYEFGSYINAANEVVRGDVNIFFAQLADGVKITAGAFTSGQFILSGTCTGAALAIVHEAKPANKKKIMGMFAAGIVTVILTGITEPIEFAFLFVAFPLFIVHSLVTGLGFMVMTLLDVHVGTTFAGGLFDYTLYGIIPQTPGWMLVIPITVIFGVAYYFLFRFLIRKFNFKTPGREDENNDISDIKETERNVNDDISYQVINALGGVKNIKMLDSCATRLRVTVNQKEAVKLNAFKAMGASGVMEIGDKNIQIIFGPKALKIKDQIKDIMNGKKPKSIIPEDCENVDFVDEEILSPLQGQLLNLEDVPDKVFSGKMMGEGFAIKPAKGIVCAPVNGKINNIFPTKHAIGILSDTGKEILIHIGMDTVKLKEDVFKLHVKEGDFVEAGQLLLEFDLEYITTHATSIISPVVFTNMNTYRLQVQAGKTVALKESNFLKIIKKGTL